VNKASTRSNSRRIDDPGASSPYSVTALPVVVEFVTLVFTLAVTPSVLARTVVCVHLALRIVNNYGNFDIYDCDVSGIPVLAAELLRLVPLGSPIAVKAAVVELESDQDDGFLDRNDVV